MLRRAQQPCYRIGHDPFDGDAEASVTGERGFQMGDGAACFLIGEDACIHAGERTSHFLAVTGDTPATAAAFAGVCRGSAGSPTLQHHLDPPLPAQRRQFSVLVHVHMNLLSKREAA